MKAPGSLKFVATFELKFGKIEGKMVDVNKEMDKKINEMNQFVEQTVENLFKLSVMPDKTYDMRFVQIPLTHIILSCIVTVSRNYPGVDPKVLLTALCNNLKERMETPDDNVHELKTIHTSDDTVN